MFPEVGLEEATHEIVARIRLESRGKESPETHLVLFWGKAAHCDLGEETGDRAGLRIDLVAGPVVDQHNMHRSLNEGYESKAKAQCMATLEGEEEGSE